MVGGDVMTVFLDMDGVLADFVVGASRVLGEHPTAYEARHGSNVFWSVVSGIPGFYANLPLMPDAIELWDGVVALTKRAPTILTGVPWSWDAETGKRAWAARHFPCARVLCCAARDKALHCLPGDVLVDDRPTHRVLWEAAGGVWIAHASAVGSLADLARVLEGSTNSLAERSKLD